MNRFISYAVAVVLVAVLSGCGTATKTIMLKSQGERTDVFREVSASHTAPVGFADVLIKANIKTHLEEYFIAESNDQAHGKQTYPFLVNIDGQAVVWNAPGAIDKKPAYDENGKMSLDPEARDGMKYVLEKKIQLRTGKHKVFFGLSEDQYYAVTDIEVKDGNSYVLEFTPIYRYKTSPTRIPSFFLGISRYDVRLSSASTQ
jgi:hypothetical protein